MDDLISRQAAIDVIDAILPIEPMKNEYTEGITCGAALAIEYVKQLPSAEPEIIRCGECKNHGKAIAWCQYGDEVDDIDSAPTIEERKKGKWNGTQNVECDQCGHLYPAFMRLEKYCPNCGARMEVGHE